MKRPDILPEDQEHEDIRAIKQFIDAEGTTTINEIVDAAPGPSNDNTLEMAGLSRREQIRRVVDGLDATGEINYVSPAYIESIE